VASARSTGITSDSELENAPLEGRAVVPVQDQASAADSQTEFQEFVAATTGQQLAIFGASLFQTVPSTFSPSNLTPVTSEYVMGPDDELRVRIWGQITYSGNLRVDRSGDIFIPQVGIVHVAGLRFSDLDQHLRAAVSRIYRNFDLSVDVGQTRSMQIYITGQARRPGVYTVSSLSSLVDTLFASGGPSPQGSLRHIRLNRDGKTVADFDLYALLVRGDKSQDVRLLPEEVLNIPAAGPQVAITGSIRSPGIYELREGETIGDLIEMAGKTTAMASSARISLERIGKDQRRQAMEFGLDSSGLAVSLNDGDILRIYPIFPAYRKTVTLRGNVANPGRFSWRQGMRISDLIPDRDSLESRDYWWKRSDLGLPVPEFESIISAPQATLASALTSTTRQESSVSQTGNTQSVASQLTHTPVPGGAGQSKRTDVRLSAPEINWDYAVIERLAPETLKTSLIPFDLGKLVLSHDASQDLTLQPGDAITIFSQADIRVPLDEQTKYVDMEGEFVHAGIYSVLPGETLRDVARRAGGFTQRAYLYGSEFTRESNRLMQQQRLDEYVRSVRMEADRGTQALAISGGLSANTASDVSSSRAVTQELLSRLSQIRATGRIVLQFRARAALLEDVPAISLENGDKFVVPYAPATVNVVGAVYDQNSFLYQSGRSVSHYLQLAGGPNRNADRRHAFVIRADGSVVSRAIEQGSSLWSNSFERIRLNPGDTIVVPDKTLRPNTLRGLLDWTQVFSQLALGSAAINILR
jgi:protein involved in polysaccharide export with SLBB domain